MSAGVAIPEGKRLNKYGDLENIELTVEDWMTRWEKKHIGFHKGEIHELLQKHSDIILNGRKQIRIFVPLCGKSLDMKWFADQGHTVVGVEASKMAIKEFFAEQNLSHTQESVPGMPGSEVFKSSDGRISLFNCNVFDFSSAIAGKFDGIWDRGSLVAINPPDRKHYVKLMTTLMAKECHYLLDTFTYDQDRCAGPPFSIPKLTIEDLYGQSCNIQLIESSDALTDRQRLWGLDSFIEQIYQITLKTDTDPSALTH
ncbi:probable thiopurine S-methyltransferase isoform X1 [Carcharodon carcharias]|uniref:probable thiopurine S-methyltransferase isoform X1 n=1 Tax=Carcharodon carcharias TaxID=13397 RepID=UPI001B7EAAEC|nr:probable thiopurine S-methyltransferase isoform X1 [Carcharodon carcharias]